MFAFLQKFAGNKEKWFCGQGGTEMVVGWLVSERLFGGFLMVPFPPRLG